MESWMILVSKKSSIHTLILIFFISFLESCPLISFILPGLILMSLLGTIISKQKINFYYACSFSTIGCILGDWFSYYIGWKFKKFLKKNNFIQKKLKIFKKTEKLLFKYSLMTIFFGKLIGLTRPIIPILSGTLNIPFLKKFLIPNLLGCIIWPPIYFSPGIFTEFLINKINVVYKNCNYYNSIIIIITILIILIISIKSIFFFKKK
ncbi:DedA family protein [Buchnera aphidicola]|uniref:DedA family protein n=1 Tax=Buchnera aphidicola TaxID=9 RepID=UPI0030ECBCFA